MLVHLFQKNQIKNLYILAAIVLEDATDIQSIAKKLNISQQSVKRTIQSLKSELTSQSPGDTVLIENNGKLCLSADYKSNPFKPIVKLANTYLSDSSSANLLKLMIQHGELNLITLSHDLHISPSYCYTLIKQLNVGLKKYDIELVSHNNMIFIKGAEIKLIFLTYYFNKWQYELDDDLLSAFLLRHPSITSYNNTDDTAVRLEIFKEVLHSRGRPKESSEHFDQHLDELYTIIQADQDYFPDIPAPQTESGEELKRAVTAITHLWVARVESSQDQIKLSDKMMVLDNPITELAHNLISSFIYRFNLEYIQKDKNIYALIFFHLTINLMYIQQFRIDFSNLFYPSVDQVFKYQVDSHSDLTVEYKLIETFMDKIPIESSLWDLASAPNFKKNIYRIFYAALNYSFQTKVSIYVDISASIDGLYLFKQKLSHVFSSDFFYYTDSPEDADIVFIDKAKKMKTTGQVYLVYNLLTNQKWQDMFSFIMEIYFEKLDKCSDQSLHDYFI